MGFIGRHIKKAEIFGALLLLASLLLCVIKFFQPCTTPIRYAADGVYILAALFGLGYTVGSFKKESANLYKVFMFMTCLACVLLVVYDLVTTASEGHTSSISAILETVNCVNLCILAFAKDLGKNTSIGLGAATLGVTIINSVRLLILYSDVFVITAGAIMSIAIAVAVFFFVLAKYANKAARGTK